MSKSLHSFLKLVRVFVLSVLVAASYARASETDKLLDLLVKKHVVTEEEAADLRKQMHAEEPPPQSSPRAEQVNEKPLQAAAVSKPPTTQTQKPDKRPRKNEITVIGSIPLKLSGYVQTRWTDSVGTNNPFEIRRARIALDGKLNEKMGFRVQVDAVKSPILVDARFEWRPSPYARLTLGQFKIPFSQENLTSGRDLLTVERSAVVNKLVPGRDNGSSGRDIGAQLEGEILGSKDEPLVTYSFGVFNGAGINRADDNRRKDVAARIALHPLKGLSLAGDYYNGESGPDRLAKDRMGVELTYVRGRSTVQSEYIWGRDDATRKRGWYVLGAYRFVPKLEGVFRFDSFDPDRRASNNRTDTYLGGINWYLSRWVKLQADYGLVDDGARDSLTNLILTQLQFQF